MSVDARIEFGDFNPKASQARIEKGRRPRLRPMASYAFQWRACCQFDVARNGRPQKGLAGPRPATGVTKAPWRGHATL